MKKRTYLAGCATISLFAVAWLLSSDMRREFSYRYDRAVFGDQFELDEDCYMVPRRWVLESSRKTAQGEIVRIARRHSNGRVESASLTRANLLDIDIDLLNTAEIVSEEKEKYKIYRMPEYSDTFEFWSVTARGIVVLSDSIETLRALSVQMDSVKC